MPQRGNDLQLRVAASVTLGKESDLLNRNAVAAAWWIFLGEKDATALRLKFFPYWSPRVDETATLAAGLSPFGTSLKIQAAK